MRAVPPSPAPIAAVPVTPSDVVNAVRVAPQCVAGWSRATEYTVLPVPPSMLTIRSPSGCTARPETADPASVACHSIRVVRADAVVVAAFGDWIPPAAVAVSCVSMVNRRSPAGINPTLVPASKVDAPVWNGTPASFKVTSIENGQLVVPAAQPSERGAPVATPPSSSTPSTRKVAEPTPLRSVIVPETCTVSPYTNVAPVQPVLATAAGYVTPPASGTSL